MLSSSISNSDPVRLLKRVVLFAAGLLVLYPMALLLLSRVPAPATSSNRNEYSLYQYVTRDYTLPGGFGYTLKRYREIEQIENIDILFIGSSRCYYSIAPHIFEQLGLSTFNMGTPSQTPLNTRYLLDRYYEKLNPKLVVFEVNPHIMRKDGVESFYDLMINTPVSLANARMSLATEHPHAISAMTVRAISSLFESDDLVKMQDRPMDEYLAGGAVVARNSNQETFNEEPREIDIPDRQLDYLDDIIELVHARQAELILVVAPIPNEWDGIVTNYDAIIDNIRAVAQSNRVRLYDFNQAMTLDSREDFKDFHHLNANGAKIFSYDILDSLLDVPDYRRALDIDPLLAADIYAGRGIAFAARGDFDKAISDYHLALALTPESGMIYYNQARACQQAGRIDEAINAYRNFIKYAPDQYAQYVEPVRVQILALEGS